LIRANSKIDAYYATQLGPSSTTERIEVLASLHLEARPRTDPSMELRALLDGWQTQGPSEGSP
jgi:hypothetical protein